MTIFQYLRAIFANEATSPTFCADIGVCENLDFLNSQTFEPSGSVNCDICEFGIDMLAKVFETEKNQKRHIELSLASGICPSSAGLAQQCIEFVVDFIPKAMPVISELFLEAKPEFCGETLGYC